MTESELTDEVARRTGLPRAHVETVMAALGEIRAEQRYTPSYTPGEHEVEDLIRDAGNHPLGLEFLLEGNLCAVATLFGVHAFTVDAARQRLKDQAAGAGGA